MFLMCWILLSIIEWGEKISFIVVRKEMCTEHINIFTAATKKNLLF